MNIGIVGTGKVASNLGAGLARAGHRVKLGSRDPRGKKAPAKDVAIGTQAEAVAFGDLVILAVPLSSVGEVVHAVGAKALRVKIVVDATNAFPPPEGWPATTSAAEEIAKLAPGAKVVKAFNTAFAPLMATGQIGGKKITAFVAGDDAAAKKAVMGLAGDIGFDPIDAGPLAAARNLEPMAMEMIALGFGHGKMGSNIGLMLVR